MTKTLVVCLYVWACFYILVGTKCTHTDRDTWQFWTCRDKKINNDVNGRSSQGEDLVWSWVGNLMRNWLRNEKHGSLFWSDSAEWCGILPWWEQDNIKLVLDRNFCVWVCVCSQDGLVNAFVTEAVTRLKITASFIYSLMPKTTSNE